MELLESSLLVSLPSVSKHVSHETTGRHSSPKSTGALSVRRSSSCSSPASGVTSTLGVVGSGTGGSGAPGIEPPAAARSTARVVIVCRTEKDYKNGLRNLAKNSVYTPRAARNSEKRIVSLIVNPQFSKFGDLKSRRSEILLGETDLMKKHGIFL